MPKPNEKMFGVQHRNAIAKDIRETFPQEHEETAERHALIMLMMRLCNRFSIDDYEFDASKWLDQCSPDTDRYPLSELWED